MPVFSNVYLNNAATSFPKPDRVVKRVSEYLKSPPYNPRRVGIKKQDLDPIYRAKETVARLIGAESADRILFSSGGTASLNLAINGLASEKCHFITSEIEHNSVLRPLTKLAFDGRIDLDIVNADGNGRIRPDDFLPFLRPDTRAIVVNHGSNVTGQIMDIASLSRRIRGRGICLVADGSQAIGHMPIDVLALGVDCYAFTGHKGLLGIQGIGGLYIKPGLDLQPLISGGTGSQSEILMPDSRLEGFLEAGTPNIPGIISINAGIDYLNERGLDRLIRLERELFHELLTELKGIPNVRLVSESGSEPCLPVLAFNIDGFDSSELAMILAESFGIVTRGGLHCAPLIHRAIGTAPSGALRISLSHFNQPSDIHRLVEAIRKICRK